MRRYWRYFYNRWFGMSDLHSHIRWRAIEPKIPPVTNLIDVGCGDGALTLEVAQARPEASVRGVDLDAKAIAIAEKTRKDLGVDNISYECADVRSMPFGTVDGALLLDIIEHLDDDHTLFTSLGDAIKAGGFLLISTPTPNFPRFFGREFHKAVGHVRDGYTRRQIESLLEVGKFELESCSYSTKLPSAAACALSSIATFGEASLAFLHRRCSTWFHSWIASGRPHAGLVRYWSWQGRNRSPNERDVTEQIKAARNDGTTAHPEVAYGRAHGR